VAKAKGNASRGHQQDGPPGDPRLIPSAQTILRWNLLRLEKLGDNSSPLQIVPAALRPLVWLRSRSHFQAVDQAQDAEDLITLAAEPLGAAEEAWHARLRQFGPPVAPLLAQALGASQVLQGERRNNFVEHLVAGFYWFGDPAAAALAGCLDSLDDYGKSLACVVLGLLRHQAAAGRMRDFLSHTMAAAGKGVERLYVGPLWGLIDLNDARAADAIVGLLGTGIWFYELPGFVAIAGDLRCVDPVLIALAVASSNYERRTLTMSLACVMVRSGEAPFRAEVLKIAGAANQKSAERLVADLSEKLSPQCEAYLRTVRFR
jgi:hypothetical protein